MSPVQQRISGRHAAQRAGGLQRLMLVWWALDAGGHKTHQPNTLFAYSKCNERKASLLRQRVIAKQCMPVTAGEPRLLLNLPQFFINDQPMSCLQNPTNLHIKTIANTAYMTRMNGPHDAFYAPGFYTGLGLMRASCPACHVGCKV